MRTSPLAMAIIYFLMGILFIYIATQTAGDTVWNVTTIILAVVATMEIGVGIRLVVLHFHWKNKKKE
ncbi:YdiK family protein [Lentibacillus sediminis]|uniref:YdiK family protein n=1 Tax=Lentibacillus sediminis TaxID=1940529 RepID=UPI000C1BCE3C|nr:YdiK family protein [Lentibacillus sediminis]